MEFVPNHHVILLTVYAVVSTAKMFRRVPTKMANKFHLAGILNTPQKVKKMTVKIASVDASTIDFLL